MLTALVMALAMGSENYVCWKQAGKTRCVPEGNRVEHGQHTGRSGGRGGGPGFAFFEFAPASGAGMGAACAGTAVTGAKGETVAWNRAGSAYCTKEGAATTGLTTTSMVLVGSNLPRVEANGKGGLGLRYERDRTNSVLRNQEMDHATWGVCSGAPPVPLPDTATTPWGTLTADTLVLPTGGFHAWCQTVATTGAGVRVLSVYARDISSSNGVTLRMVGTGDSAGDVTCEAIPIPSTTTWSRIQCLSGAYGAGLTAISVRIFNSTVSTIPNVNAYFGGWQLEDTSVGGPLASSLILTTSAAVARAVDAPPTVSGVTLTGLAASGSSAVTVTPLGTGQTSGAALVAMSNLGRALYFNTTLRMYDGTVELALAANHVTGVPKRYWSSWAGGTQTLTNATDATNTSGAFDGAMAVGGPLQIGSDTWVGTISNFILSEICLDPVSTRCR